MNEYEAEEILVKYEKWDTKQARHTFIARMERNLFRRKRLGTSRRLRPRMPMGLKSNLAH